MSKETRSNQIKQAWRASFRTKRASICSTRRKHASLLALETVLQKHPNSRIASFFPIHKEIDLHPLNQILFREKKLFLPKRQGQDLVFYFVETLKDYCLDTPQEKRELSSFDLLLLPGLAFDSKKYRLGYGGGYYDRFLERNPQIPSLAIGFQEQFTAEELPRDSWDVPAKDLLLL